MIFVSGLIWQLVDNCDSFRFFTLFLIVTNDDFFLEFFLFISIFDIGMSCGSHILELSWRMI